jgi:hypothetical protein
MSEEKTDPPMEPKEGTTAWFETLPDVLSNDEMMAGVMVRVGMAVNALTVHLHLGYQAGQKLGAVRERDNLVSLAMSAALAFEARVLAQKYQAQLRPLLLKRQENGDEEAGIALKQMGTLLSGNHPASALLERARNNLVFHFDYKDEFIGPIVRNFARNEKIVWVEEVPPPQANTVHRFAIEVLAHALFPEADTSDSEKQRQIIEASMGDVRDAINIIASYFTMAAVAYLGPQGNARSRLLTQSEHAVKSGAR